MCLKVTFVTFFIFNTLFSVIIIYSGDTIMNLIQKLKNMKLFKDNLNANLYVIEGNELFLPKSEEINYDEIVNISDNDFIDATSDISIQKYKSNLKNLVESVKQKGYIDNFKSIREDDFFPYNYSWSLSCRYTGVEKSGSVFTYELRKAFINNQLNKKNNSLSNRFVLPSEYEEARKRLPKDLGFIYNPIKFRSTKHFTVNTPLGYTGEYNHVESNRNFTIIDNLDNISKSGYAYSISYFDAYLDITHENLPISKSAVILIDDSKYNDITKDPIIKEQLMNRRVIRYKGDQSLAINMVLTELGILPYRPGNRYYEYYKETKDILENSIKKYCDDNNIPYNLGHGNINGKGGHFSDNLDTKKNLSEFGDEYFVNHLRNKYPNYSDYLQYGMTNNEYLAKKIIELIGVDELLSTIEDYNNYINNVTYNNIMIFKNKKDSINSSTSKLFKDALNVIKMYYNNELDFDISEDIISTFFHSYSIEEQIDVSNIILNMYYDNDVHKTI